MKKYSSGSFIDAALRVYGSEADTITSFPASIIADGENASAVIYGNMTQSGTPTTTSPIYPSECGELVSSNYTIPIISGGVTTNIDLSAVQSTRIIKKLVLTGAENWERNAVAQYYFRLANVVANGIVGQIVCSHFISPADAISQGNTIEGIRIQDSATYGRILIVRTPTFTTQTTDEFITFLSSEYANNTPVTIWYVLSAETTSTLNEPLRKIGDYADSVAAAAIPTTAGSQTFKVDTTLKPSSVSLTYTGWHTHSDKQYSGGSWGAVTSGQILRRKKTTKRKT